MSRIHQEASLSDDVYYQLKDYILSNVIHPPERLQIAQLSQHFGVSITPIREALIRLSAEALVELRPGRGFFYRDFVPAEQSALYDALFCLLKYAIERGAARPHVRFPYEMKTVPSATPRDALRTEAEVRADVAAAEKFLEHIAMLSGNAQIGSLVRSLCERTRISRILDLEQPANASLIMKGVQELTAALQRGDAPAAITVLREQIEQKRLRMIELANERRRRLYEAHPLLRPGGGRHVMVRYRDDNGGTASEG
jgi:DNA-binding GntR family transcriptional regulator